MKATKRGGGEGKRERKEGTPMDFFPYREFTPCRCLPLHPLSGSVHDVLRARVTPDEGSKKIQPPICRVGGLFNCDIQYLFAIHLFFFFFFSSGFTFCWPFRRCYFVVFYFCLSVIFEASTWLIRARCSLIFRRFLFVLFSLFFFLNMVAQE